MGSREVFNFELLIFHATIWFSRQASITSQLSLGTMNLAYKVILRFKFFTWRQRLSSQRVMWLDECFFVTISHHLANFDVHRLCGRENIMFSIWHVTTCDHIIRESCNFILSLVSPLVNILQYWVSYVFWRNVVFILSRDLTWPRSLIDSRLLWCS